MRARIGVKERVRSLLHRAGLDLVRSLDDGHLLKQAVRVMDERRVGVVFDVGANSGQWARTIRALGYRGQICSFEPVKEAFRALDAETRRDDRWTAINCAVGEDAGEAVIHVSQNSQSSSILGMLPEHREADPHSRFVRDERVRVATLGSAMSEHQGGSGPFFVKVDVQGYGSQVLNGAGPALSRVVAMQMELSLVPLYEGEPLIEEVIASLRSLGFVPASLEPNFRSSQSGHLLQVDGLFIRPGH
jgi:FkbM family methyltransferase